MAGWLAGDMAQCLPSMQKALGSKANKQTSNGDNISKPGEEKLKTPDISKRQLCDQTGPLQSNFEIISFRKKKVGLTSITVKNKEVGKHVDKHNPGATTTQIAIQTTPHTKANS